MVGKGLWVHKRGRNVEEAGVEFGKQGKVCEHTQKWEKNMEHKLMRFLDDK